jgi:hypothetical protein
MMYRQCRHNRRKTSCTSQTLAGVFCYDYALSDARRNIITNSWTCVLMPASVNVLAENSQHNNSKGEDFFCLFSFFGFSQWRRRLDLNPLTGFLFCHCAATIGKSFMSLCHIYRAAFSN